MKMLNLSNTSQQVICLMFVPNFKILAAVIAVKSLRKNFIGEKEKQTNKRNDKHQDADSLLYNIISHTQCLYQISKS